VAKGGGDWLLIAGLAAFGYVALRAAEGPTVGQVPPDTGGMLALAKELQIAQEIGKRNPTAGKALAQYAMQHAGVGPDLATEVLTSPPVEGVGLAAAGYGIKGIGEAVGPVVRSIWSGILGGVRRVESSVVRLAPGIESVGEDVARVAEEAAPIVEEAIP